MRLAPTGGNNGLNDEGTTEAMAGIREAARQFRQPLVDGSKLAANLLCRKILKQIDKYGDRLFADPIAVNTPDGTIIISTIIYPQRTNNILEQLFRA